MDDRLVQDEVGLGEAGLDVSEAPLLCGLAQGKPSSLREYSSLVEQDLGPEMIRERVHTSGISIPDEIPEELEETRDILDFDLRKG